MHTFLPSSPSFSTYELIGGGFRLHVGGAEEFRGDLRKRLHSFPWQPGVAEEKLGRGFGAEVILVDVQDERGGRGRGEERRGNPFRGTL